MDPTPIAKPLESTIMSVWPSISALPLGRWLGRMYGLGPRLPLLGIPFRPGWLIALATLPVAVFMYFNKIVPRIPFVLFGISNPWCRRYRLTNERVVIEHPFDALSARHADRATQRAVRLSEFDAVQLDPLPGQEWYCAADLVFRREGVEVLRLPGVPHAEAFRQTCLKARRAYADGATFAVDAAASTPEV